MACHLHGVQLLSESMIVEKPIVAVIDLYHANDLYHTNLIKIGSIMMRKLIAKMPGKFYWKLHESLT